VAWGRGLGWSLLLWGCWAGWCWEAPVLPGQSLVFWSFPQSWQPAAGWGGSQRRGGLHAGATLGCDSGELGVGVQTAPVSCPAVMWGGGGSRRPLRRASWGAAPCPAVGRRGLPQTPPLRLVGGSPLPCCGEEGAPADPSVTPGGGQPPALLWGGGGSRRPLRCAWGGAAPCPAVGRGGVPSCPRVGRQPPALGSSDGTGLGWSRMG